MRKGMRGSDSFSKLSISLFFKCKLRIRQRVSCLWADQFWIPKNQRAGMYCRKDGPHLNGVALLLPFVLFQQGFNFSGGGNAVVAEVDFQVDVAVNDKFFQFLAFISGNQSDDFGVGYCVAVVP